MDSLASLALATEAPKDNLLERPPYRKKEYIISRKMVKHIGGQAIF
jgi:Ca2+ transporting ATPase